MSQSPQRLVRALLFALALSVVACDRSPDPVQAISGPDYPARLSQWRVVLERDGYLELNENVTPYALSSALFTDYAHKLRTVWLPPDTSTTPTTSGELNFPMGTIISKTFYYPLANADNRQQVVLATDKGHPQLPLKLDTVRLLETRILTLSERGWEAMSYVWNADQTDAELAIAGDAIDLTLQRDTGASDDFTYIVPDKNQCAGCHVTNHTTKQLKPIGPRLRHLSRPMTYGGEKLDQLRYWTQQGLLTDLPASFHVNVDWSDQTLPLEARARAYLDINCGHCHNSVGAADTSGLWLDATVDQAAKLGVCKPPIAAGRGSGGHRFDIVPSRPDASIMVFRMASRDPAIAMPELGRALDHKEGTALVAQWIAAMDGQCPG